MSPVDEFRTAMLAAGLTPPDDLVPDGALHRFPTSPRRGDKSGWYVLHLDDIPAGGFGCWREDVSQTWCAKSDTAMSDTEREAHRQRLDAIRAARADNKARHQQQAAQQAARRWDAATPATTHPYLTRKGVQPHGTRCEGEALLIPMRDAAGELRSLQVVDPEGEKRFHTGGQVTGCHFGMGRLTGVLVVCEGFATGASIHEATGHAVAVAFNAGNLQSVALAMRAKFPDVRLVVAADDDHLTPGNPGMTKATSAALAVGALVAVPVFPGDRTDKATDFNDLHQLAGLEAVRTAIDAAGATTQVSTSDEWPGPVPLPDEASDPDGDGDKRDSLASQLVAFVCERTELFHDENRDVYAFLTGAQETFRLTGANFKNWLMAEFFKATGKAARDQSVREALMVLTGLAQYDGALKAVHVRVAKVGDAYFLDLGQPGNSLAAKIEAGRWELVAQHEVRFIRPESMRPLPTPDKAGSIATLWGLVNVPEASRLLVLAWLVECLRPDTDFPVLELLGEAGSAKSSAQKALRRLIDPNASNLRSAPKSVEDVFVSAGVNWIASFENISHLAAPMQDALCVLATGGGYAKRKLYSDGDESVINVMRPVVLNGISACVTAHDLIDRSVCVELPVLRVRREGDAIERAFEEAYPGLVGGLLNLMAQTLKELPDAHLAQEDRPRMAGFARLGVAVERALNAAPGEFLRQFHASRRESIERTIDGSPVASALVDWFESRGQSPAELSAKALFAEVERFKPPMAEAWPKSPKGFGDALRRAAPSLRYMGLEVRSLGKIGGSVKWGIRAVKEGGQAHRPSSDRDGIAVADPLESVEVEL